MALRSWLCTTCGSETSAPGRPGSPWVAVALAVPFVIPGIAYTVWRYTTRRRACPFCAQSQVIPSDAPLARTWRAAGWIPGQPALTTSGERLERIEQAIDAIAVELDRVGRQQLGSRLPERSASSP